MRLFKVLKSLVGNKPGVDPIPAVSYDAPATIIDAAEQDGDLSFVATTFSILNGDGADIGGGNQPTSPAPTARPSFLRWRAVRQSSELVR